VVHEGAAGDAFYIVLAGRIEVVAELGRPAEVRVAELGPGTWFGEHALLAPDGRRSATVRALETVRCAVIPSAAFTAHVAPSNRAVFDERAAEDLRSRLVHSLDALRDLDPQRRLGGGVTRVSFRPGETVFAYGQAADAVYFVLAGMAVAVRDHAAGSRELARLGPGQCFGELGVLEHEARRASVIAESALEVLRIEAPLFAELFAEHPPLRDFLGTLQRIYALADGRRLSVYRGEVDGRPSISTVSGDPAGDCVVSTKILGEDVVVLSRGGGSATALVTERYRFPDGTATRELRLEPLERTERGTLQRARLVGIVAQTVRPDVGPLCAHLLAGDEVGATELRRFARTGYLGGDATARSSDRVCHCLGLGRSDILGAAREHGATLDAVATASGAGVLCGACRPVVAELLRGETGRAHVAPTPAARPHAAHAVPVPIPRCPALTFDRDAVRTLAGSTLFQVLLAASLFASAGERYMIRHVGQAFTAVDDPALAPHVEAFLAQESNHVTIHTPLNDLVRGLFPDSRALVLLHTGLPRYLDRLSERTALAFCAAIEHAADSFFSVFFERYYGAGPGAGHFQHDPELEELTSRSGIADLFIWHGAEELAHRHVAFEVMQARGATYGHRVLGFLLLAAHSTLIGGAALLGIRRQARGWRRHGHLGRNGGDLVRTIGRALRFLLPGFHPRTTTYAFENVLARDVSRHPVEPVRSI
jgi:CRP-like cAMP-binding protein/predicted metal-dependent hydrolase/bacterioferritin-associated ferredoxin